MRKAWTGPAVIEMTLTELGQHTGRVDPELASGGVIRVVNRKQRRTIGYLIPPEDLPLHLRKAEEILGEPRWERSRGGRVYDGRLRDMVVSGDLASMPVTAAARVLGLPVSTVGQWRQQAGASLNGASA